MSGDVVFPAALNDLKVKGLAADILRVAGLIPRVLYHAEQLTAHELAAQAELRYLAVKEVVHRLRAAHENAVLAVAAVLFDEVGGDEAMLVALALLVGEDVDDVDLAARGADLVQLLLIDYPLRGA